MAWGGHALLHQPLHVFDSNTFWPLQNSFAFSDSLLGFAPVGVLVDVLGQLTDAPITTALVGYNALFIGAYALAFLATYLLARETGVGVAPALVAGAVFTYAPWRLAQNGHLNVISSGGIPLTLFLLLRGYRRGDWRLVLGGWLVATWQIAIGWAIGLLLVYILGVLGGVAAWHLYRGRWILSRSALWATASGMAAFLAVAFAIVAPYYAVLHGHPESRRTRAQVAMLSPPVQGFFTAPEGAAAWGAATASSRRSLGFAQEMTIFPGLVAIVLAGLGCANRRFSRRYRFGLVLTAAVTAVLAYGIHRHPYVEPYRLLYDFAPGWQGIRTSGRLIMITTLALALLAAAGAESVLRLRAFRSTGRSACAAGALLLLILLEGLGPIPLKTPPAEAPTGRVLAPIMHLPFEGYGNRIQPEARYMFWSIDGFPKIVNGASSFEPTEHLRLNQAEKRFPSASSVDVLRRMGVRTVILHVPLVAHTPWDHTAEIRDYPGLRITRRGPLVIFRLPQ